MKKMYKSINWLEHLIKKLCAIFLCSQFVFYNTNYVNNNCKNKIKTQININYNILIIKLRVN